MMIAKRQIYTFALAVLVAGAGYAIFCFAYDRYEGRCRTRTQRTEAKRQAYLNQPVRGCLSGEAMRRAAFRMTTVGYFGGHLQEWDYADGKVVYRERPGRPGALPVEVTVGLDDNQQSLLADILNLVVKQKLWTQSDVHPQYTVMDGGEDGYAFSVNGRVGHFKVINTQPKHLDIFRHKCWKLMDSFREKAKVQGHNKPSPPAAEVRTGAVSRDR